MYTKLTWKERAKETEKLHKECLSRDDAWSIRQTADLLRRSVGSISEDLTIASWLRTHPQIEEYKTAIEALDFIRAKKYQIQIRRDE